MVTDLFAFLPESTKSPAPPPRQDVNSYMAETMPAPRPTIAADQAFPGAPVASFACPCGARDEVMEPAPDRVDCWGCRKAQAMNRWTPPRLPPSGNSRQLTEAERSRM